MTTYLGQKGYTIYKRSLSIHEQHNLRQELTVAPFIPGSPVKSSSFPIYRESEKKFYVPRYYGIQEFGEPDDSNISEGDDINVVFAGELRDYQQRITDKFVSAATQGKWGGGGLLDIYTGAGKTVMALNILSRLKKKTLIIVHKGFLVQQWEERIKQYLPTAKIGKIQAKIVDIEDKDIVIGMLQSLSMKEYHEDQFKSFGLTIVDEVHHISSEVFCRSLVKIVTKYTLGLSATMNRKDGLTKVFKMYLGDIIHKEKRSKEHSVLVKAVGFETNDPDFNEVHYDYRGNPQYSTMIRKLCEFNERSEFIIRLIKDFLAEDSSRQMIVLAHNKSLLVYLHDALKERNIASVGYYIGGMKEADLKQSETKKVIIATYAMAAEALDIKTLTTLLLATPKTDVVQAVGRILRQKGHQPLVIDVLDTHEPFQRQWEKRLAFYHKEGYEVKRISYSDYRQNKWMDCVKPQTNPRTGKKETPLEACVINKSWLTKINKNSEA